MTTNPLWRTLPDGSAQLLGPTGKVLATAPPQDPDFWTRWHTDNETRAKYIYTLSRSNRLRKAYQSLDMP